METYLEAKKEQLVYANSTILVAKVLKSSNAVMDGYKSCVPDWCELLRIEKFCDQFKGTILHIPERDILSEKPIIGENKEKLTELIIKSDSDVLVERVSHIKAENLKNMKPSDCGSAPYDSDDDEIGVSHNLHIYGGIAFAAFLNELVKEPTVGDLMKEAEKILKERQEKK